jgi:uncharacterized repeat protein (TIGR01451 family)
MRKTFLIISVLVLSVFTTRAQAQENPACQPIFGGGDSCVQEGDLALDKKLKSPTGNDFLDNTSINDPKFAPNQPITFRLTVKNTGNRAIENITVTDTLPQYVTFTRGPGQFDRSTNTVTFTIDKLEAGQSRAVTLEAKIVAANAIPGTTGIACVVNQAKATQGRNTGSDNAEFCLQKSGQTAAPTQGQPQTPNQGQTQIQPPRTNPTPTQPMPVYQVPNQQTSPKTGPELLALIGLLPAGAAGLYLRRKTS